MMNLTIMALTMMNLAIMALTMMSLTKMALTMMNLTMMNLTMWQGFQVTGVKTLQALLLMALQVRRKTMSWATWRLWLGMHLHQ